MREERGRGRGGAHRGRADLPPPPSFQAGDSDATKLVGSLENATVFVALVTAMTFALVAAFKAGWSSAIQAYMAVSGFSIFFVLTGIISLQVVATLRMTVDAVTFAFLLWNFAAAGVGALFLLPASPLALKQMYLVVTGVVTAFIFTYVPEWTTWALLGAMAAYDLYAVLTPNGPLRLLVETAIDRGEDIPALVYEGRARVGGGGGGPPAGRRGSSRPLAPLRARRGGDASLPLGVVGFMADTSRTPLLDAEAPAVAAERRELGTAPAQPERERERQGRARAGCASSSTLVVRRRPARRDQARPGRLHILFSPRRPRVHVRPPGRCGRHSGRHRRSGRHPAAPGGAAARAAGAAHFCRARRDLHGRRAACRRAGRHSGGR